MRILLIGSGGREHAIASKLLENRLIKKIYCAPGNAGTKNLDRCENIFLDTMERMAEFAEENQVDITIAGSEEYLVKGIYDIFAAKGLRFFGPNSKAAMLEGSKSYAKNFMKKYGIKTAAYEVFDNAKLALKYLDSIDIYPIVIKADGLAFGKGVVICEDKKKARKTIIEIMDKGIFKEAGNTIVIEQYLDGKEASILSFCDGKTILPLLSAKDHKRIFDGDKGDNTGGMGAISPNPYVDEVVYNNFMEKILEPTLNGIEREKLNFVGVIFFGLMIVKDEVYLLEYNVRMGDPETQTILPLMESDLLDLIVATLDQDLDGFNLEWKNQHSVCVTMVSKGYPGVYEKGYPITGINSVNNTCYIAGAKCDNYGQVITDGGRVLNVVALGETYKEAFDKAYSDVEKIKFKDAFYRKDIGK